MDNSLKIILKKLEEIDNRIKRLEEKKISPQSKNETNEDKSTITSVNCDPLFDKAVEIINKYDEISSKKLAEELKIDIERAEKIMDQMEAAGLGVCYTKEV